MSFLGEVVKMDEDGVEFFVVCEHPGGLLEALPLDAEDKVKTISARHIGKVLAMSEEQFDEKTKAWSKEAREAAIAARKAGGKRAGLRGQGSAAGGLAAAGGKGGAGEKDIGEKRYSRLSNPSNLENVGTAMEYPKELNKLPMKEVTDQLSALGMTLLPSARGLLGGEGFGALSVTISGFVRPGQKEGSSSLARFIMQRDDAGNYRLLKGAMVARDEGAAGGYNRSYKWAHGEDAASAFRALAKGKTDRFNKADIALFEKYNKLNRPVSGQPTHP